MNEEYIGLRFNKLVIVSKAEPYIDPSGPQYTQVEFVAQNNQELWMPETGSSKAVRSYIETAARYI